MKLMNKITRIIKIVVKIKIERQRIEVIKTPQITKLLLMAFN